MVPAEQILEQRKAVIAEAHTWIGTPYAHMGSLKGVGVDCAMILREVYGKVLSWMKDIHIAYYPPDWHLHQADERYLNMVRQYADEVEEPEPGDIVVVKFGRAYAHGAIVVDYPTVIHAYANARLVVLEDFKANKEIDTRKKLFFSPWKKFGEK
jgi:NlpC/P60 family putative phage cell wall peptidase